MLCPGLMKFARKPKTHGATFRIRPPSLALISLLIITCAPPAATLGSDQATDRGGVALRQLSADFNLIRGERDPYFKLCVGSEHCAVLMRPENQAQLAIARKELGFEYVRCHGTFDDDMGVYREVDGKPVYSFDKLDQLYLQLRGLGMRPFIELTFMPEALARGKKTVFHYKANVTQPKDYQRWGDLISALAAHLEQRFGVDEVRHWYFEVWNEPNHPAFWDSPKLEDYEHMYDVSAAAIKKADPQLRVGGPATAGCSWVKELIAHCQQTGTPIDFISTHTYASKKTFDPDGKTVHILNTNPNAIFGDVQRVRKEISASAMPSLPLHFTEWSTSSSSRDPVHDAYLSASFILDKVKKCEGITQSMSYWTYSDLFEEAGPPPTPFHGGFGLLTREGVRKASFFAYKYLNELGRQELQNTDGASWLCRDGHNFSALFWDATPPKQTSSNDTFFRQIHPASPLPAVHLHVTNVPPGDYVIEIYRTGFQANDAYSAYLAMGLPVNLSPDQLAQLQAASTDAPESRESVTIGGDGIFDHQFRMRTEDVVLVLLKANR
jgi:xylan 1,4-beta-xylosidase